MSSPSAEIESTSLQMQVECGRCEQQLPLRLRNQGEPAAVWLCACCSVPFVALCVEDRLPRGASTVRLDERYFDVSDMPTVSPKLRRQVADLAHRATLDDVSEKRRSQRVAQSLVVPAIQLNETFTPTGFPFQLMVANLSREGIGLVHKGPIESQYVAIELGHEGLDPIQVIVRLIRQKALTSPFYEIGGEFYVRLGSQVQSDA